MKTIVLHQLGRTVSRVGIGSANFDRVSAEQVSRLLDTYQAAGGNLIDTAEVYAGGSSEQVVGKYLRERGSRPEWILLTKVCAEARLVRPDYIRSAVPQSLERLQTDRVDLLALHRDDESVPVDELVDVLCELRQAGLCCSYGVSNWSARRIAAAIAYARAHSLPEPSFSSPHLGLATPREPMWPGCTHADTDDILWYAEAELPVFGWSSQCRGFFANRLGASQDSNPERVRVYHTPENFAKLARASQLAEQRGLEPTQIALAWALNQRATTVALVGPNSIAQLRVSLAAADIELDPAEVEWLGLRDA